MSSGVHKHRSPDDGEGVSPYFGMGANWMFLGSLGRIGTVLTAVKVMKHHELRDKDPNEPLYRKWDRPS